MQFNPGEWLGMGAFTMRYFPSLVLAVIIVGAGVTVMAQGTNYHLGTIPRTEDIQAWDNAIGPAGKELPPGSGTAKEGANLYKQKCAACHGPTGKEGHSGPPFSVPRLVGGKIGSSWPFATTIWDYINRAMPRNQEGSLKPDEVYAVTAFNLSRNGIIQESDVMDAKSLPKVRMPNRNGFIPPEPDWKPGMKRPFGYYPGK